MSGHNPQQRLRPQIVRAVEPEITFTHCDRLEPGEYPAYCRKASVYRDRQFQRWICLLQFDALDLDALQTLGRVTRFLNLGGKECPHAGRRGNYWAAWVQANGGPPGRRDRLSAKVFEKRMARILVGDSKDKTYSVVREIKEWETGKCNNQNRDQTTN